MQTVMEKSPGKMDMIVKRVSVPVGLEELMEGLTKEVLLKKPKDLYLFASEYFSRLIILRERSSIRKAYPIRVVQSVSQAKTPLKPTRHLSRQISVRGKDSVVQKEEAKKVVALSKVSTPKEKKVPSNESTPRENKRALSSVRGQQLKPKGKTREKLSVPGKKVDEVIPTSDKKAVRHLKKSDAETTKVKTVEAVASEVDNSTGAAAIKVKRINIPKNGDKIIDDNPKKRENIGPGDSKMAHNDKKYMSVLGKAVSSLENDSTAVETEDEAKMKIGEANFSKKENIFKPSEDIDSSEKQKDEDPTIDRPCQERKETEKALTVGKPEADKTTLNSFEDTEVVIDVNTPAVDSILEQAHRPEIKEDNIDREILNQGDSLQQTKIENADLSERRIGGNENVDKTTVLKSDKIPNTETIAKIEENIDANADEFIKNKSIDTVADERDRESSEEISTNGTIEEDNERKINNQVEQVHSEVITIEEMGTKLEKQNKIEGNVDCPDEDIEASTIPKDDSKNLPKKSTKLTDKEENGPSAEDLRNSANTNKISNKAEDVGPAETLLSEATKSKARISKHVEDSTNQIKLVNESVDEYDEQINKTKDFDESISKITKSNDYSNNQDDKPNEEVSEPSESIKADHSTASSKTDEQSSSTNTENKVVNIEMQQLGSFDDMLIVSISDRRTPDAAAPEATESANSEPKLQFFRKSEELVQKENGKIRETLDIEHLSKLIGTSATPGHIDASTKEFLRSFLSNEQQYSSKDQESSRKTSSGAMVRKVIETESLGSKGSEPITLHKETVISELVPDAIIATSMPDATTIVSEKSDGIQLSEKESFILRGSDSLTGKASDATPQTQKVEFECSLTHGEGVVMTAPEVVNEDLEQLETLKITETETTTKHASDVKASESAVAISDLGNGNAVESGLAISTYEQHKPLKSMVKAQQVDSQAQEGALELAISGSEVSVEPPVEIPGELPVESQKLTTLAETSNDTQLQTATHRTSEAISNASKQFAILPIIDSDTSTTKDSEVTHLVSNHTNLSENEHVHAVQSEEPLQKSSHASVVTKQDTSASLENLSSSFLQSEQTHSRQTLKDASEVENVVSELSTVETIQPALKVRLDVSEQSEEHEMHVATTDESTVKNSDGSSSVTEKGKELMPSSLERQHLQSAKVQKTTVNTYDAAEPETSETAVPAFDQYTAAENVAASESAHTRTLIHSFLLSEQQHSSQTQNDQTDLTTVATIEPEKRKLLTPEETSKEDASETINNITTLKQPSCTADSDRTKVPKAEEKELTNRLDQLTNYPAEDLNQKSQSNESRKTTSKISDNIPEKSSELGTATSKQEDLPTFKSVKDLLDYDNLYITNDSTESSSGTKSLQLIIVDEDRSEENEAAKIKRSATTEDVEEMASFAEDSVVMQQRGLIGQETLRGFSIESSGEKMDTSNSSSSGCSYGVVKSDISSQSVSECVLVEDRTGDGEAIKEISEQLISENIVNKEANAGGVVSSSVEAGVATSVTTNERVHVKDAEMKIGSSTTTETGLMVDGENVVGAIGGQHDDLVVRSPLNGDRVKNDGGFESRIIETVTKDNNDTVDKTLEDVVAGDWVKDEGTKETSNDNTESPEKFVANVLQNDDFMVTSSINDDQVANNEGFQSGTTETVTEVNVDIVNKAREETVASHSVKDEIIKETPSKNTEPVESLVAEVIAGQNQDLAIIGSDDYHQMENKGVDFGTTAITSDGNGDAVDKINEGIVAKDQVIDKIIKDSPSKSTESMEKLVTDTFAVGNDDLVATGPLNCDQMEYKKDIECGIFETVTKVHVNEVDQTREDIVAVDPTNDESVNESSKMTEPAEKLVEVATTVRNEASTVAGPFKGDQVKDNQAFESRITKTVSEANDNGIDEAHEDVVAKDLLNDEATKETPNSISGSTANFSADAIVVQNDYLTVIDPPNYDRIENKINFEPAINETISKTNVGEVDKTLEDMVAIDPVKDKAVKETVNNNTETAERLIVDAIEHRAKEFAEEVVLNEEAHKADEEKYSKELQASSKENTFVKDAELKRPPKIGEIEQVASVIEVVNTIPMVTKHETSPKKPRKSKLALKERSVSHLNVLIRERSKSSSSERGEPKIRRTQSVGVLKFQDAETKSRIPTSESRRSAGRRPLVRQLEANSKELAEKLNFKRSSDGESGEGDEKKEGNSGDAKLTTEAEELVKEVDREKGGYSTDERSIPINENQIDRKSDGVKEQNSSHDQQCAIILDEVGRDIDVKAGVVKSLKKGEDFNENNSKSNERNSIDDVTSTDIKEIAKSVVENVETLATEALGNRKTNDLKSAKEAGNESGDPAVEESGKTANAAIKIQSAWKGFITRKMLTVQRKERAVVKIQALVRRFLNQLHLEKMKNRDVHSSADQLFRDTITDFTNGTSQAKDEQGTLAEKSENAQMKLDRTITIESINVLSDSSEKKKNDPGSTETDTKESVALKTTTIGSEIKHVGNSPEKCKRNTENVLKPVLQSDLGVAKEKDGETVYARIDHFVTATDGTAKENERLLHEETVLSNKVEYFSASTKSINTNDFQHEAKDGDTQVDVNMKKKDNDHNKEAELNVNDDLKTEYVDKEANGDNDIRAGHPDSREEGSAVFEDVERKVDINHENLQTKDEEKMKTDQIKIDIKTNENGDIKFLERIRSTLKDDSGDAKEEDGETEDAKIENLEFTGSAKQDTKLSEAETLADNKMEDIPASTKSLEINDLRRETNGIEAAFDMKEKDYAQNEAVGLNVNGGMKLDNTDMETKRDDITIGKAGERGDTGFKNEESKVDINDEKLQIKNEDKKKSNDIGEIKIEEDDNISAVKSQCGKDGATTVGLKADPKHIKFGSDKRETDINGEALKSSGNEKMESKSTDNKGDFREGENAEPVKENDIIDKITKDCKMVDEENLKIDERKVIQGTLRKKDIEKSNIEEVVEPKRREALSSSIVETTKIDNDEVADQSHQTDAVDMPTAETAKVSDQLNRQEQQNATVPDTEETLKPGFNEYLGKIIDDAEPSKVLKMEAAEPENYHKRVAESGTDVKKIEESAGTDETKTEIIDESIKVSSNLKEIPSKVIEPVIEDISKNTDIEISVDRGAPNSEIADTTLRHIEDDGGSSKEGKTSDEVILKESKANTIRNEAKENNGINNLCSEATSQLTVNSKVEDDSQVKEENHDVAQYIGSSKENAAQLAKDRTNESTVEKFLDSKPDFYRSDTVTEPLLVEKRVPYLTDETTDSNNNTSKDETPLEEGVRAAVSEIMKPTDVESLLQTLPHVPTHDLPPAEDDLNSFGSTDSVVTVIMKPKQEVAPRTLPGRAFSTSALEDRVELLDQVQNSLLDQLSGKSKFDIDQLRKELHDATLYKEESPPDPEVLEYLYDFDPEDDPEYERVARTPLRELPDIAEEDDVPETSGGLTNEIVIGNDSIEIGKEHQRLLHTGELHDSVLVTNGQSLWDRCESRNRLKHTSEFHDTVVVPLPSGADVKITNASKAAAGGAEPGGSESGGAERDRRDSGNQTSDQQPPAGAEAVTSQDVGGAAQAALKDTAPAGPESARPAQSPARTVNEAMESENNNNKRNNAIATNVPERNMEAQAATKIQAGFRGYQVRKQLKAKNTALDQKRQLRKRTSRDNLKNPDLEEKSAVKIQAGVRGFLVRRRQKKQASNSSASA